MDSSSNGKSEPPSPTCCGKDSFCTLDIVHFQTQQQHLCSSFHGQCQRVVYQINRGLLDVVHGKSTSVVNSSSVDQALHLCQCLLFATGSSWQHIPHDATEIYPAAPHLACEPHSGKRSFQLPPRLPFTSRPQAATATNNPATRAHDNSSTEHCVDTPTYKDPRIQRTDEPTNHRTNDTTTQQSNDATTQRTNEPTTQQSNDPTTQRTNDPTTQRQCHNDLVGTHFARCCRLRRRPPTVSQPPRHSGQCVVRSEQSRQPAHRDGRWIRMRYISVSLYIRII